MIWDEIKQSWSRPWTRPFRPKMRVFEGLSTHPKAPTRRSSDAKKKALGGPQPPVSRAQQGLSETQIRTRARPIKDQKLINHYKKNNTRWWRSHQIVFNSSLVR